MFHLDKVGDKLCMKTRIIIMVFIKTSDPVEEESVDWKYKISHQ